MRSESSDAPLPVPSAPAKKARKTKPIQVGRVRVYERTNGFWSLKWKDMAGEWRSLQRKDKDDAMAKAREIRDSLDFRKVKVTDDEREIIALARQLRDPATVLRQAIHAERQARGLTVADLCARVVEHYKSLCDQGIGRHETALDARRRANAIVAGLGDRFVTALTGEDVLEWLRSMDVEPRTRGNRLQALRNAIRLARAWCIVPPDFDPTQPGRINAHNFPELFRTRREDPCVWTPDDFELALSAVHLPRQRAYLILCGCLGLRPAEAAGVKGERDGIRWSSIDFDQRTVTISRGDTKTSRPRIMKFTAVPGSGWTEEIADAAWSRFTSLLLPLRHDAPLHAPVTMRNAQRKVSPLVKAATGKDWPTDGLRHTWISALLAVGVHKDYVAKMAGNSVSDIDVHYEKALQLKDAARWLGMHYST